MYNIFAPYKKGGVAHEGILLTILSSLILPLLAGILFQLWKENRNKDNSKKQD